MTDDEILHEIVRRLVEATHPDRIVLYGSRARGEAGPDSDYDILIIAPSDVPRWKRTGELYMLLGGLGISKDIVWYTQQEVDDWRDVKSHFITTALREGKVIYDVAA